MNATMLTRTAIAVTATAAMTAVPAAGATAYEPQDHGVETGSTAYSTPLDALGGRTLARYVADHVENLLGQTGV